MSNPTRGHNSQPCKLCGTSQCPHKRAGLQRARSFTREYQQQARAHVTRESLQRSGAAGFAAVASKYGLQYATEHVASWRRAHPSSLEQTVMGWLDELRETYEHDRPFKGYMIYADFQVHAHRLVVEVDGRGFHKRTDWLNEGSRRAARDELKDEIYRREGYRVLRLSERDVRSGSARQALQEACHAL